MTVAVVLAAVVGIMLLAARFSPEGTGSRWNYFGGLVTVLWGLVFGAIDDDLGELTNWLFAAGVGAIFVVVGTLFSKYEARA